MRYLALATDYDGTLALRGKVDEPTLAAMERLRGSGRRLILVTGRVMDELKVLFPHLHLFDWVVAENGALLYRPSNQEVHFLAEAPPPSFIQELKARGVAPLSIGGVIIATWHPHETTVLEVIRDLGLEFQVIFNKDAVMVLPAAVNKATGLNAALERMGLSPHNVVAVGDAENDHAMMSLCGCSAAVENALRAVKERADIVLKNDHGAGVAELIDLILANDLQEAEGRVKRHQLLLGKGRDGQEVLVRPFNNNLLIAGPSGSGKSTVATGLLERLGEQHYQYCILDPEGDYASFEGAIVLGGTTPPRMIEEVLQVLKNPQGNAVVNMVGLPLADRPGFFLTLLTRLLEMRAATGRPHWLIIDEAHHLLPTSWQPASQALPPVLDRLLLITVHPEEVSPTVMALVKTVIAVGPRPEETLQEFVNVVGAARPVLIEGDHASEEVLVWFRETGAAVSVRPAPSRSERRRHIRKYATGELPPDRSFYFRGPENKLNLRAQNLILFMQLGDGVDEDTWKFHLRQGDVSRWFTEAIKDQELAQEARAVEQETELPAQESRARIRAAIEKRYTLPASSYLPMPGTDARPQWARKEGRP